MKYDFKQITKWFNQLGWEPFQFQTDVWREYLDGNSGLIHASTGTGKTYAAFLGAVIEALKNKDNNHVSGLNVLWITPLRALASDTQQALERPIDDLGLNWKVEKRTGDTSASVKARLAKTFPEVLITTPESLSLLLSYPNAEKQFANLKLIITDEWHELISSKRGVLTELSIARLKNWNSNIRIWGLSATIGNTESAMATLLGKDANKGKLITGVVPKAVVIETMIPEIVERFPWAGHLGINLLDDVIKRVDEAKTCILFTNTRSQTEIWFQAILNARPDWAGLIALHHGSLDKDERKTIEEFLRDGKLKCVVATSSLDLGVDFSPVDRVIQVGSPKGIARLLQRAGRSGHNPGRESIITCVPTHAFELIEFAAVKSAIEKKFIEPRYSIKKPLDVLSQHLVTIALGTGFQYEEMYNEVRSTHAYEGLTKTEWDWVLDFITKGGPALRAYPEYRKVVRKDDHFLVENKVIARRHRMSIGTITSDSMVIVQFVKGGKIGTLEESFVAKMKPGDTFIFAGKALEYVRIKDMTVWVRKGKDNKGPIPQWMGGRMPLSTELASEVREKLDEAKNNIFNSEELQAVEPILNLQKHWSDIPARDELLIERLKSKEGYHLFFYPFEGKLIHEGLAALIAFRISAIKPITFSISANDYGFELLSAQEIPVDEAIERNLFSPENLVTDILASLNSSEMAKRQFREIARIAGLIFQGFPGSRKAVRQVQASSGLFYEVFKKFDPENLLLSQATKEVLENQLEQTRLYHTLTRVSSAKLRLIDVNHPTPLAFPIMVNRFRAKLSSEKLTDRIKRMQIQLEKAAGVYISLK